jgi:hypothetical protein
VIGHALAGRAKAPQWLNQPAVQTARSRRFNTVGEVGLAAAYWLDYLANATTNHVWPLDREYGAAPFDGAQPQPTDVMNLLYANNPMVADCAHSTYQILFSAL